MSSLTTRSSWEKNFTLCCIANREKIAKDLGWGRRKSLESSFTTLIYSSSAKAMLSVCQEATLLKASSRPQTMIDNTKAALTWTYYRTETCSQKSSLNQIKALSSNKRLSMQALLPPLTVISSSVWWTQNAFKLRRLKKSEGTKVTWWSSTISSESLAKSFREKTIATRKKKRKSLSK